MALADGVTVNRTAELETVTCGGCGLVFAVPARWLREKQETGGSIDCPNADQCSWRGISWSDSAGNRLKRLQRDLKKAEMARDTARADRDYARRQRDHQARRASTYKGHLTRTKRRVGRGVCPCCTRTFENLQRHMETKHPDYVMADE